MMIAKSCPRCRGDLSLVRDVGDTYFSCLQCGHTLYENPAAVEAEPEFAGVDGARWPEPVDRSLVRRRQLRQMRKKAAA